MFEIGDSLVDSRDGNTVFAVECWPSWGMSVTPLECEISYFRENYKKGYPQHLVVPNKNFKYKKTILFEKTNLNHDKLYFIRNKNNPNV